MNFIVSDFKYFPLLYISDNFGAIILTSSEIIGYYSKPPLKSWSNPYKTNFNITFVVITVLTWNSVHILTIWEGFVKFRIFRFSRIPGFSRLYAVKYRFYRRKFKKPGRYVKVYTSIYYLWKQNEKKLFWFSFYRIVIIHSHNNENCTKYADISKNKH